MPNDPAAGTSFAFVFLSGSLSAAAAFAAAVRLAVGKGSYEEGDASGDAEAVKAVPAVRHRFV